MSRLRTLFGGLIVSAAVIGGLQQAHANAITYRVVTATSAPTFVFGRTPGEIAGLCTSRPALGLAFAAQISPDGRVTTRGVPGGAPVKRASPRTLDSLGHLASQEGFYSHMPAKMRDTRCSSAATTYIRIHKGGTAKSVRVLGLNFVGSSHPNFTSLFAALLKATGILPTDLGLPSSLTQK